MTGPAEVVFYGSVPLWFYSESPFWLFVLLLLCLFIEYFRWGAELQNSEPGVFCEVWSSVTRVLTTPCMPLVLKFYLLVNLFKAAVYWLLAQILVLKAWTGSKAPWFTWWRPSHIEPSQTGNWSCLLNVGSIKHWTSHQETRVRPKIKMTRVPEITLMELWTVCQI